MARRDKLKLLYWDGDGLAIWYRRLEQGTFQMPTITDDKTAAEINRWQAAQASRPRAPRLVGC